MTPYITVFGATGTQGSSVLNAILEDRTFTPRAVTRNPDSDAAKKLQAKGVEVVRADLSDKESIRKAIAGSEGVFGITQPLAVMTGGNPITDTEVGQGKNLIDACKEVGVKFFVWSSLPSAKLISNGKYSNVSHLDDKFTIEEYLRSSGLPHANVYTGNFAENIYNFGLLGKTSSGSGYDLTMPRLPITFLVPLVWIEKDLGPSVLALFKNYNDPGNQILGQTFYIVSERITYANLVKTLADALGKPVTYKSAPTSGIAAIDEMWDFVGEFGLYEGVTTPDPRLIALGVKFSTLKQFAEEAIKPRFE